MLMLQVVFLEFMGKKKAVFISHYIHNVHSYSFLKNLAHIFFFGTLF